MKYIKEYWKYIVFVLGFIILASTFVYTRLDFVWILNLKDANLFNSSASFLVSINTAILANVKILRILSYGIFSLCFFWIIKNIINQKNHSLIYIGIFLFFLINQSVLNVSYVSIYGFVENFIPMLFTLVVVNYIVNDNLYKLPKPIIAILGLISSLFTTIYAVLILAVIIYKIVLDFVEKSKNKNLFILLVSTIIGCIFNIFKDGNILIGGVKEISDSILYNLVPEVFSINFIFTIIMMAFLFYVTFKRYFRAEGYEKVNLLLSIGAITIYAFAILLSKNTYLNYLSLIFYIVASYYILTHGVRSFSFKEKIKMYYFVKVVCLVIYSILKVDVNMTFILAILDIVIILELINNIFPTNFLQLPYMIIAVFMIGFEIVMSANTKVLIKGANNYLKRDLSCDITDITLPSKYKEDMLSIYLPSSNYEKKLYLLYLGIDGQNEYNVSFTK